MSTSGYSDEELASLSEEERAAIEADVDEPELTAKASPVDLPDDDGEEDGEDAEDDEGGEDGAPEGDDVGEEGDDPDGEDAEDDEGEEQDTDDGDDPDEESPEGDEPDDGDADPEPVEYDDKEEPVNPFDYSDAAQEQIKDLREKLNDGELSPAEYDEQVDKIKSDDYKQRMQESENRRWGKAVNVFLSQHKDYTQESNPTKFAALDSEVKRMVQAGEIGNMGHMQILEQAKSNVEKAFGFVPEKPKPDAGGKKNKGQKTAKPKSKAPDAPNLGDVPAAGVENPKANNSEFAHLDKLTGVDLETALEKMTPAQQERYLAGR
jgi:hypothetical protein